MCNNPTDASLSSTTPIIPRTTYYHIIGFAVSVKKICKNTFVLPPAGRFLSPFALCCPLVSPLAPHPQNPEFFGRFPRKNRVFLRTGSGRSKTDPGPKLKNEFFFRGNRDQKTRLWSDFNFKTCYLSIPSLRTSLIDVRKKSSC